ncbi:AAA domain-containing protein [Chaetomium fimeti]|uniref:AAA domain-containing protein n=1 Tax=Chaetomium fimeti TaxID=1854472 RepID=A0AAE0HAT8_9PEZI|nr:AAA domain-containing protein [Chaetomium fimeti]
MPPQTQIQANGQPVVPVDTMGLRAVLVFGSIAGVGKTIVTTALCIEVEGRRAQRTWYLRPTTMNGDDTDARHVEAFCDAETQIVRQCGEENPDLDELESAPTRSNGNSHAHTVSDGDAVDDIMRFIGLCAGEARENGGWVFIEPPDGVMTPSFTGLPHAEEYRPLGFPVVLVGPSYHDGVSATISAFESLELRGYNVMALVVFREERWKNYRYLDQYFRRRHPSVRILTLPDVPTHRADAGEAFKEYYNTIYDCSILSPLISLLDTAYR